MSAELLIDNSALVSAPPPNWLLIADRTDLRFDSRLDGGAWLAVIRPYP